MLQSDSDSINLSSIMPIPFYTLLPFSDPVEYFHCRNHAQLSPENHPSGLYAYVVVYIADQTYLLLNEAQVEMEASSQSGRAKSDHGAFALYYAKLPNSTN